MRIQLELNDEQTRRLDEMKEKIGAHTYKEFFNTAMTLTGWAIRQKEQGRTIASIDNEDESYRELSMPNLDVVPVIVVHQKAAPAGHTAKEG